MSPGVYEGMFHVAKTLIKKEGPFSLYKGITAPLAFVIPFSAMGFFSFGAGKSLISQPGQTKFSGLQLLFAGMFSGACTTIVAAPGERIKCLLQAQVQFTRNHVHFIETFFTRRIYFSMSCSFKTLIFFPLTFIFLFTFNFEKNKGPKKYKGFFDCAQQVLKEGGIRNLYLGTCATLLRDMPSCATYFYCYERIMDFLLGNSKEMTWQPLLAGGTSGIATWLVSLPADSVKTRLQISPMGTYPRGVRSIFPIIMKEGGILGLYRGVIPVLIRAFIANAVCFYSLEFTFDILDKYIS
ncbi:congested-like trachea protein isoform X1 [Polistes fuscatus]|uniref:congested-like trachea protein isoform X1 n=1 Tax=Polistes fuscatus TaxID=30207 RepID=UPI001CA90828|nr:congested-like trachea protein isoform X1 [Polistes fuscatus]